MKSTDFSPIAEQGDLELDAGLFSRLRRRRDVAPIASGYTRVLLDENGEPLHQVSAGQKYWSRARGWVKVDVRTHTLEYEITFDDPSGLAGFVAHVGVSANVVDAPAAVADGAESVEAILEPLLRDAIRHTHGRAAKSTDEGDQVAVINALAINADASLEGLIGKIEKVPPWLAAEVTSVTVELDEVTREHREELLKRHRAVALAEADGKSEVAKARADIEVREVWRASLTNDLQDPIQRAIERIASDPSKENIDRVMAGIDQEQAQGRAVLVEILRDAVGKDYFDKDDPIHRALSALGPAALERIAGGGSIALERGEDPPAVSADGTAVIEGQAETVEEPSAAEDDAEGEEDAHNGQNDDRDWGK